MPRFTPEMEHKILQSFDKSPSYAKVGRELGVDEKAVKSVVERFRNRGIPLSAEKHPLPKNSSLPRNQDGTTVTGNELKQLSKFFLEGRRLARIVAEEGFDPVVVQKEHERFLQFEGLDPHSMQAKIMNRLALLVPARGWVRKELFDIYKDKFDHFHYLNGRQFEDVITMLVELTHREGLNSWRPPSIQTRDGWTKPICVKCGKAISALIFNPPGARGIYVEEHRPWYHEICATSLRH